MLNIKTIAIVAGLALSAAVVARAPEHSLRPVYVEGSQYSAVLEQGRQHWRLLPSDGTDLDVSAVTGNCDSGQRLPEGLWLLTRDAAGHPSLTAPSATSLPEDYPEEVPLLGCGEQGHNGPYVTAPQGLVDWLAHSGGAILVQR